MSSAPSGSKGLQPIYAALDSHQYSRAIKLCLAQTSPISRALLAHAYAKSGHRAKALATLQSLLNGTSGGSGFPELQVQLRYALALEEDGSGGDAAGSSSASHATTTGKKSGGGGGGKRGKKKPAPKKTAAPPTTAAAPTAPPSTESWHLVDNLDTSPTLPLDWEEQLAVFSGDAAAALLETTLLATLSMTMTSILHLPLTAYQLYCWALRAASNSTTPVSEQDQLAWTRKAFMLGLTVQLAPHPSYTTAVRTAVLANMQVLALQLARLQVAQSSSHYPATLWAAQTALWQLDPKNAAEDDNSNDPKQQQRRAMLPRLAESFASKCVQEYTSNSNIAHSSDDDAVVDHSLLATESFLLYMKALDCSPNKCTEKLQILDARLTADVGERQMSPPRQTLLELKLEALQKLNDDDDSNSQQTMIRATIDELLRLFPDDWEYWQHLLQHCINQEADGDVERGCSLVEEAIRQTLEIQQQQQYPLRGPHLMRVELAARQFQGAFSSSDAAAAKMDAFVQSIRVYGDEFAPRATCAYSDLQPYLRLCLDQESELQQQSARYLLQWSAQLLQQSRPSSDDTRMRRQELRTYIFAVKVQYTVLRQKWEASSLRDAELPSWEELVTVWKDFQSFEVAKNVDQAQKESRPADELILLAVQRIFCDKPTRSERMTALCLLEASIRYSPYNAYLKIAAMFVCSDLNAASRSWELYNDLYIKHIQNESCSYLVLPMLRSGGLYAETIHICQEILGLQRNAMREAGDFSGSAMENGAASKAEEILNFQRDRMTKSLTTLEAKGLVLDCAPLLVHEDSGEIGVAHGIVGGEADVERARQIIAEAHNPSGAFTLLRMNGSEEEFDVSENRDFGIMSFELLVERKFDSVEQVLSESMRRARLHNLLIRAALCIDASKPPKKGKVTKASTELVKCCKSFVKCVEAARKLVIGNEMSQGYGKLCESMLFICSAIAALSTGMNSSGKIAFETIESREEAVVQSLSKACDCLREAREQCGLFTDPSVPKASRLLPDCVSPLFALFLMCAKLVDMYGWGRRKVKTKQCAAAVADLSKAVAPMVRDMKTCLDSIPDQVFAFDPETADKLNSFIDESIVNETCEGVLGSQQLTRRRIEPILDHLLGVLDTFDIAE